MLAHIPLIQSKFPADAHYFFLNLLSVVRLNFANINSSLDDLVESIEEFKMIEDADAFFSAELHNFGYRFNFAHNMLLIASAALILSLAWVISHIVQRLRSSGSTQSARASKSDYLVRFALEAHFELMVCSLITVSNPGQVGSIYWFISLASLLGTVIALAILAQRTCKLSAHRQENLPVNVAEAGPKTTTLDSQTRADCNTNEPLSRKICDAIDIEVKNEANNLNDEGEMLEGGETEDAVTDRDQISTQRGMVTE